MKTTPYNFPYAGYVLNSTLYNVGSGGYYWSRTAYSAISAYNLSFYSSDFIPGTSNNARHLGFSVRCVANS